MRTGSKKQPTEKQGALSPLHAEALRLASLGVPVFPCLPEAKEPASTHGFHDATTDPAVIDGWWTKNPDFNVAYQPQKTGEAVIDIDGEPGEASWAELEIIHGTTPETKTVLTPRGGRHLYFKGDLPPSVGKLGFKVDTRGGGSYALLPPSIFRDPLTGNVGTYRYGCTAPAAPLMAWPGEKIAALDKVAVAATDVDLDLPINVARARSFLQGQEGAVEGEEGNARTYRVCCDVLNLGLSEEKALALMLEVFNPKCLPEWESEDLAVLIGNAARYAQNGQGAWAVEPASVTWAAYLATMAANDPGPIQPRSNQDARVARFRGREPDEDAELPMPAYWDRDKTLPKIPGGTVGVAFGQSKVGKTFVVSAVVMDAILSGGARVLYLAGEGGHALGTVRTPALCKANGITPKDLRGRYRKLDVVPNLNDPQDIAALIDAQRDFNPDIIVIDTLATALCGADENAASTGGLLTGNGPAGQLKRAFDAAVIFVAHSGKGDENSIRGSSAFAGNVDFIWKVTSNKAAGIARREVTKMKDGPDDFSVHYKLDAVDGVPVARRIPEAEYRSASGAVATVAHVTKSQREVYDALKALTMHGPVPTEVLAETLVPHKQGQSQEDRERLVLNEVKRLQGLTRPHRKTQEPGVLAEYIERDRHGDPVKPFGWRLPAPEPADDDED